MPLVNQDHHAEGQERAVSLAHAARPLPHALLSWGSDGFVEEICIEESYGLQAYLQILEADCEHLTRLIAVQTLPDLAFQRATWDIPPVELLRTGLDFPQFGPINWSGRYKRLAQRPGRALVLTADLSKKFKRLFRTFWDRLPPLPVDHQIAKVTLLFVGRRSFSAAGTKRQSPFSGQPVRAHPKQAQPWPGMRIPMISSNAFVSWARRTALGFERSTKRSHTPAMCLDTPMGLVESFIGMDERCQGSSVHPLAERATQLAVRGDVEERREWPRISVVTVSFNQARFLRECLESVLDQNYPNLDFVVIDGGSTDGSREILESYRHRLSHLVIEPDRGQSHALNKGFKLASGDVMTWLCSDDRLEPGSLEMVARIQSQTSCDLVVGGCRVIDGAGRTRQIHHSGFYTGELSPLSFGDLASFTATWQSGLYFYQPEVFFTRDLWSRAGSHVKEYLHYAMDYEMFLRFALSGACLFSVDQVLASSRQHEDQKTRHDLPLYLPTVKHILKDFHRTLAELEQA